MSIVKKFIDEKKKLINKKDFENINRKKIDFVDAAEIEHDKYKMLLFHKSTFCFDCILEMVSFNFFKCKKKLNLIEIYNNSRQNRRMAFFDQIEK